MREVFKIYWKETLTKKEGCGFFVASNAEEVSEMFKAYLKEMDLKEVSLCRIKPISLNNSQFLGLYPPLTQIEGDKLNYVWDHFEFSEDSWM